MEPDMRDEWIKHDGGPCPVPPETWVQIKNKDGMLLDPAYQADFWAWDDVSAYRIFAAEALAAKLKERKA
jgi:hypothetical protein